MKAAILFTLLIISCQLSAQVEPDNLKFEPNEQHPWGRPNPNTPEVKEFDEMIGTCDCRSVTRNADQTWADTTDMVWKFKYIMNGTAVQDEVWRNNGQYAGSIRQYHQDSAKWVVTYFSNPGIPWVPGIWYGSRMNNEIVLFKDQKAPNGMDGFYRITFYDLRPEGFNWKGEWVNPTQTFSYPTWLIFCVKRRD